MRLDKFICSCTLFTRTEAKKIIKKGVLVNGVVVKNVDYKIDEYVDKIEVNGEVLNYKKFIYIMLHKAKNIITATEDNFHKTVVDLLKEEDKILNPFPVGRLDKDTEGLILLTNDGELSHKLLSPKKDIDKKYYVEVNGELTFDIQNIFLNGIVIDDGYKCKSAKLEILSSDKKISKAYITISEGKFHQIKRMMRAVDLEVTYLKRLSIGNLVLDNKLKLGEYRYLTEEEINKLKI